MPVGLEQHITYKQAVVCQCGEEFRTPRLRLGLPVYCPACGELAAGEDVSVACSCGRRFSKRRAAKGETKAPCPSCATTVDWG